MQRCRLLLAVGVQAMQYLAMLLGGNVTDWLPTGVKEMPAPKSATA